MIIQRSDAGTPPQAPPTVWAVLHPEGAQCGLLDVWGWLWVTYTAVAWGHLGRHRPSSTIPNWILILRCMIKTQAGSPGTQPPEGPCRVPCTVALSLHGAQGSLPSSWTHSPVLLLEQTCNRHKQTHQWDFFALNLLSGWHVIILDWLIYIILIGKIF